MHSLHDYKALVKEWTALSKAHGLKKQKLCDADGFPVFAFLSSALYATGGIYLSAGIHGDEAAGCHGLLKWAEENARSLKKLPLLILPCLNPWGLQQNRRSDFLGDDLNRAWSRNDKAIIVAVKQLLLGRSLAFSLMLHEDYDAEGIYLYEHLSDKPHIGEDILKRAGAFIAPDPRSKIEGRNVLKRGLFRFKASSKRFDKMGHPESIFLFENYSERCVTFESPSEFAPEKRVAAHKAAVSEVIDFVCRR